MPQLSGNEPILGLNIIALTIDIGTDQLFLFIIVRKLYFHAKPNRTEENRFNQKHMSKQTHNKKRFYPRNPNRKTNIP
jgi:hypothetical protein